MNIFILDYDKQKSASYHCDKHVVKMVTETAQMLCTGLHMHNINAKYKPTHKNHPCTIWAASSRSNWLWLKEFGLYLYEEYRFRYNNKLHKAGEVIKNLPEPLFEDMGLTNFALAMPEIYKCSDVVKSYRDYYLNEKYELFHYTKRKIPYWIK